MAEILLINRDDIMRLTSLRGNIDLDKLLPHIKTSQDIHLQPIIGATLLEKCKTLVDAGTLAAGAYKTLIEDYIAPVLVFRCMIEYIPFANYEIANGGVFKPTPENATPLDAAELDAVVQRYRDKAEFYGHRLEDYLVANSSSFPEFSAVENGKLSASGQGTFHSWVI